MERDSQGTNGYELKHLFSFFEQKLMRELLTAEPGKIKSFDPQTRTASITLSSKVKQTDGSWLEYGVINCVPVVLSGGGGYYATYPVKPGDGCLLIWQNCSIDQWFQGNTEPIDPRKHHLTDVVALVGLSPSSVEAINYDPDRAVFGNKGPRIACDGSTIHLGVSHQESATEAVILGTKFSGAFDTFINSLSMITNPQCAEIKTAAINLITALTGGYTSQIVKIK